MFVCVVVALARGHLLSDASGVRVADLVLRERSLRHHAEAEGQHQQVVPPRVAVAPEASLELADRPCELSAARCVHELRGPRGSAGTQDHERVVGALAVLADPHRGVENELPDGFRAFGVQAVRHRMFCGFDESADVLVRGTIGWIRTSSDATEKLKHGASWGLHRLTEKCTFVNENASRHLVPWEEVARGRGWIDG